MDLIELLNKHRAHYLEYLAEAFNSCDGATEVLMDQKTDETVELYRLYRFDCLKKNGHGDFSILEYNNDSYLNHPPIKFKVNSIDVELNPIHWNGIQVDISGFNANWGELEAWGHKWIDSADTRKSKLTDAFAGTIHNIQRPEVKGRITRLAIDLGTAEATAMVELIELLTANDASEIRIHSGTMMVDE